MLFTMPKFLLETIAKNGEAATPFGQMLKEADPGDAMDREWARLKKEVTDDDMLIGTYLEIGPLLAENRMLTDARLADPYLFDLLPEILSEEEALAAAMQHWPTMDEKTQEKFLELLRNDRLMQPFEKDED